MPRRQAFGATRSQRSRAPNRGWHALPWKFATLRTTKLLFSRSPYRLCRGARKPRRAAAIRARDQAFEVPDVTFQTIAVDVSARRIATVLLNRPERGNAFDQVMLDELGEAFAALGAGEEARVVVVRGSGRHFCTGADLAARAAATPAPPPPAATAHFSLRDVLAALDALPKPTL